jgi:hypothetical protein
MLFLLEENYNIAHKYSKAMFQKRFIRLAAQNPPLFMPCHTGRFRKKAYIEWQN